MAFSGVRSVTAKSPLDFHLSMHQGLETAILLPYSCTDSLDRNETTLENMNIGKREFHRHFKNFHILNTIFNQIHMILGSTS